MKKYDVDFFRGVAWALLISAVIVGVFVLFICLGYCRK